jgi:hypothetical protein
LAPFILSSHRDATVHFCAVRRVVHHKMHCRITIRRKYKWRLWRHFWNSHIFQFLGYNPLIFYFYENFLIFIRIVQGDLHEPVHSNILFFIDIFQLYFIWKWNITTKKQVTINSYSKWPPSASTQALRRLGKSSIIFARVSTDISSHALISARF